jgi:hypothetical protein
LCVVVLLVVAVGAFLAGRYSMTRDGTSTGPSGSQTITRKRFALSYPKNWLLEDTDSDYDPDHLFTIDGPDSAFATFTIIDEALDPDAAVEKMVESYRTRMPGASEGPGFSEWGAYRGLGRMLSGPFAGMNIRVRVFAHASRSMTVIVVEFAAEEDLEAARPGFELVESSFRLR